MAMVVMAVNVMAVAVMAVAVIVFVDGAAAVATGLLPVEDERCQLSMVVAFGRRNARSVDPQAKWKPLR